MVDVLVVVRPPAREIPAMPDRSAEYRYLVESTQRAKDRLIDWLKDSSVWDEVEEVGEPNAFHIIPFVCSRRVAALLEKAPGVEGVAPADFQIDLLSRF
jgi:hypothetical protein